LTQIPPSRNSFLENHKCSKTLYHGNGKKFKKSKNQKKSKLQGYGGHMWSLFLIGHIYFKGMTRLVVQTGHQKDLCYVKI
jgi:hypothetical protein